MLWSPVACKDRTNGHWSFRPVLELQASPTYRLWAADMNKCVGLSWVNGK